MRPLEISTRFRHARLRGGGGKGRGSFCGDIVYVMYRLRVKIKELAPGDFSCGRIQCAEGATHLSIDVLEGHPDPPQYAYCDVHFVEFINNAALEIVSVERLTSGQPG